MKRNPKCLILVPFIYFLNQTLFFIFLILCVDSDYENSGIRKFIDEKYEMKEVENFVKKWK